MIQKTMPYPLAVLVLICFPGCDDSGVAIKDFEFVNTPWKLESFETVGVSITVIQDGRVYSITFLPDSVAQVRADCNDCLTTYQSFTGAPSRQIEINLLHCTEVACGPKSLDGRFLNALQGADNYRIQGDLLRIYYNEHKDVLNFRPRL